MTTPESVEEWGERWLRDWVADPSVSDDVRKGREWIADQWRSGYTLEEVAKFWAHRSAFKRLTADHQTHNDMNLYRRERVGLLVWRSFDTYRSSGPPVPEPIMEILDKWGLALGQASGLKEIAEAIEMTGKRGGPQGSAHLRRVEAARYIASQVHQFLQGGMEPREAFRRVAAERRMSVGAVRAVCRRWIKPTKATRSETDAATVMRTLGRR